MFQCDNTGVVAAVSKAKEPVVMHLLRSMWFFVAHFDMSISIEHISGGSQSVQHQSQKSSHRSCRCSNQIGPPQPSFGCSTLLSTGLSSVPQKSYQTGQHRYLTFCSSIKKSPLPTTEDTLFPNIELVCIALPAAEHLYVDIGYTSIFCCGSRSNSKAMHGVQLVIDSGVRGVNDSPA